MLSARSLACTLLIQGSLLANAHAGSSLLQARATRCLDVTGGQFKNGSHPQLWDCSSTNANQQWQLTNGKLTAGQNKCLDIVDGMITNGTPVQLWDCGDNNPNQAWEVQGTALKHKNSNMCLDVKDGAFINGGQLQIWQCDGRPNGNQVWAFAGGQPSSNTAANQAHASSTSAAGPFYNYTAISVDAFLQLHPECAPLKDGVVAAAADQGIHAVFLLAIAETESSCGTNVGSYGGPFQFTSDAAWNAYGAGGDRNNPWDAAFGAARYFKDLLSQTGNDLDQAMRLYNGPIADGGNPNYQKEVGTWMSGGNPWG